MSNIIRITTSIQLLIFFFHFIQAQPQQANFVPETYVIEFDKPIHAFASKRHIHSKRSLFYEQLNNYNISYDIRHEYDLINAVSVAFKSPQDSSLFFEKALGVKKAWPVNTITKPGVAQDTSNDNDGVASLFDFYSRTGINRIRDELNMTGAGIKVGVIDTGIDYLHPALGGCYGKNCRVAYGHDFVGDGYSGLNTPEPDNDPRDTCNGHGTHVAGIIGARDPILNFTGIAPDVTFGAYRIFGCQGSSTDDIIMSAMEKAYADGMDVINLSLGDVGWPESPASLLADELALKGMIVCAAAGNDGDQGVFKVGAPSLGKHAISVASVDNANVLSHTFRLPNNVTIGYTSGNERIFKVKNSELILGSSQFLAERDGCDPLTIDVQDKVVLFNRGGCMFSEKIINAQNAGAIGVLIYNNKPGMVTPSVPEGVVSIDYGGISKEDGDKLFVYLQQHNNQIAVEFLQQDVSFAVPTAGTISSFSSWGLGPDLSMKPDLSAPGGQIYSTFPLDLGSYATLSGTSMASPYVSGVVALLEQARGGQRAISVKEIRTMLINNGQPFNLFGKDQLESVARQGSGLIDAYRAVTSDTVVYPEQIELSDVDHGAVNNDYTLTIRNNGRLPMEYLISHVAASTAQGFEKQVQPQTSVFPLLKPIMLTNHEVEATVAISEPVLTIGSNQEVNVTVKISPPANAEALPPSIYSGYITIQKREEKDDIKFVPYAGFTYSLSKLPVLMVNSSMPYIQNQHVTSVSPSVLNFQLAEATPLLKIKVVDSTDPNQEFGLVPGGYAPFMGRNSIEDPNDVLTFEWQGYVATSTEQASMGTLLHHTGAHETDSSSLLKSIGQKLPSGNYKLKLLALRPFGNKENEQDYDTWLSPEILVD